MKHFENLLNVLLKIQNPYLLTFAMSGTLILLVKSILTSMNCYYAMFTILIIFCICFFIAKKATEYTEIRTSYFNAKEQFDKTTINNYILCKIDCLNGYVFECKQRKNGEIYAVIKLNGEVITSKRVV